MGNCQQKPTTRTDIVTEEIINTSDKGLNAQNEFLKEPYKDNNKNLEQGYDFRGTGNLSKSIYIGQYYPLLQTSEIQSHIKKVKSYDKLAEDELRFRINYDDGSKYEGEIDQNKVVPHGQGIFYHFNGDTYSGRFHNNLAHGKGTYTYNSGVVYTGGFVSDHKDGFGEENYANSQLYKGYFINDVKNGRGRYEWGNEAFYDGDIARNRKNGLGVLVINGVETYTGEWHDDLRHGKGKILYANGDVFEGSFSNNLKEGKGILKTSESFFEGMFANDVKHGRGIETDVKTLRQTEVEYLNGIKM